MVVQTALWHNYKQTLCAHMMFLSMMPLDRGWSSPLMRRTLHHIKAHIGLRPQLHKDTIHIHVPILDTSKVTSPTAYKHNNTSHFHTHSQSKAHGHKSSSYTDSTCTSVFISMTHEDLVAPTTFRQDATTYLDKSHQDL